MLGIRKLEQGALAAERQAVTAANEQLQAARERAAEHVALVSDLEAKIAEGEEALDQALLEAVKTGQSADVDKPQGELDALRSKLRAASHTTELFDRALEELQAEQQQAAAKFQTSERKALAVAGDEDSKQAEAKLVGALTEYMVCKTLESPSNSGLDFSSWPKLFVNATGEAAKAVGPEIAAGRKKLIEEKKK